MEANTLILDTKGYCLSCVRKATLPTGSELGNVSIQIAFNCLNPNMSKVFSDALPSLGLTVAASMKWDLEGRLCSECEQLLGRIRRVKLEMERLEKILCGDINSLFGKMNDSVMEKQFMAEMLADINTIVQVGIVEELRKELLSKCIALTNEKGFPETTSTFEDAAFLSPNASTSEEEVPNSANAPQPPNGGSASVDETIEDWIGMDSSVPPRTPHAPKRRNKRAPTNTLYSCEVCSKAFGSKRGLNGHKSVHNPNKKQKGKKEEPAGGTQRSYHTRERARMKTPEMSEDTAPKPEQKAKMPGRTKTGKTKTRKTRTTKGQPKRRRCSCQIYPIPIGFCCPRCGMIHL